MPEWRSATVRHHSKLSNILKTPMKIDGITSVIIASIQTISPEADSLSSSSVLLGSHGVVDSVGFVSLLVSLEETLEERLTLLRSSWKTRTNRKAILLRQLVLSRITSFANSSISEVIMLEKRCAIIADFTASGLSPLLKRGREICFESVAAPYDNVEVTLLDDEAACWSSEPHVAVVWTRPEGAVKSFANYCGLDGAIPALLSEVDAYCEKLKLTAERVQLLIVPSWVTPAFDRGVGALNLDLARGVGYALLKMNLRLIEQLSSCDNALVLDASRWIALAGSDAQNPKYWYLGKIAFSPKAMQLAADDIHAAAQAFFGLTRKALVLDLDDTLWGGVVGDVGWQNLDLGGHSPNGEALVDFQKTLKKLASRGTILAICSKNTESVALEALDQNPNMVLQRDDFAAWRINWDDKAQNIRDIANELNLGLNSVVFIDDNPVERERVRTALPEVLVPDWPTSKMLYVKTLKELNCFDQCYANAEDVARNEMYVAERKRRDSANQVQSVNDYLRSLKLVVETEPISESNLKRVAQLLNKTNQMNLRTRRLTEKEFSQWLFFT